MAAGVERINFLQRCSLTEALVDSPIPLHMQAALSEQTPWGGGIGREKWKEGGIEEELGEEGRGGSLIKALYRHV